MCKCPFHDDRTPSMAIYEEYAYCYACNKRWDNLDFVGEQLNLDFEGHGVIITIRDRKRNIVGFAQRAAGERKPKYKFTK